MGSERERPGNPARSNRRRHRNHHRHLPGGRAAGDGELRDRPARRGGDGDRFRSITGGGYPYLVAELDGAIVGYAYASAYRTRPGYRFTVEDSIYLAPDAHGKGIGTALLTELIKASTAKGYRLMVAVIGNSRNFASISLHRRAGFRLLRHDPLDRLQVRPLAGQRHHGAAAGRGRHLAAGREIGSDLPAWDVTPRPAVSPSPARPARAPARCRASG